MTPSIFQSVAFEGPARSGKTRQLIQRVTQLLETVPSKHILVICSNSSRKTRFLEAVQDQVTGSYGQLQITTYAALVRNTLTIFWPEVEAIILGRAKRKGKAVIFPELSGFEASEYLIRKVLNEVRAKNPLAFSTFQGSEHSLMMQLIRRVRLRAENRIDRHEMRMRSERLHEPCLKEVEDVLMKYDALSYALRVLDNSKQLEVFHHLLDTNPKVQAYFEDTLQHLIVDDVDETIPAQQQFMLKLIPGMQSVAMAADIDGGTRRGYLNAYPDDWPGLKALCPNIQTICLARTDSFVPIATTLLQNWIDPALQETPNILPVKDEIVWRPHVLTRIDMLDQVVSDILLLLTHPPAAWSSSPVHPQEIAMIMPRVDLLASLKLQHAFRRRGIPLQILTGTQRPIDNPLCRSMLLLLQLANYGHWEMPLSPLEFKGILYHVLQLHQLDPEGLDKLIQDYRTHAQSATGIQALPLGVELSPVAYYAYQQLLLWVEMAQDLPFEEQFYSAFTHLIAPRLGPQSQMNDVQQLVRSFYIKEIAEFLLAENDFTGDSGKEWLIQAKTGVVSDTPNKPRELDPTAVVLLTPQKMIDMEVKRRIHLWLDIASREWSRTDNAPLYNAWVHSAHWDPAIDPNTDSFNQQLTQTRAGHITRTLTLYAGERIFLYASELDDEGRPQTGLFQNKLHLPERKDTGPIARATLREDQAPILDYQGGWMAITAVPGAGKTFVTVELLLELIQRGIPPQEILVLTYMDSAARTLLSRLRQKLPQGFSTLPVVNTIHSLARRMITESDHSVYLGLDANTLEIADDITIAEWIQGVLQQWPIEQAYFKSVEEVTKCIGLVKTYGITPAKLKMLQQQKSPQNRQLAQFQEIYAQYEACLQQSGKLDFTDLIRKAIDLLEQFPQVREKYQERFQIIIEDEAQDSSKLLQHLIHLLEAKRGNLIRTGDTNQSITTTFSTADTDVFRNFIETCHHSGTVVEMNRSGRCAPEILNLANQFMQWAQQDAVLSNAFQPMTMMPVADQNPTLVSPITCTEYADGLQELAGLITQIRALQSETPKASIAVLLRGNTDVLNTTQALQDAQIKAICHTERVESNPSFLVITQTLRLLEHPNDFSVQSDLIATLQRMHLLVLNSEEETACQQTALLRFPAHELHNPTLMQLVYNLQDLSRYAYDQQMGQLIARITEMTFTHPVDRSLGYLYSLKAQNWVEEASQLGMITHSPLEWVNQKAKAYLNAKRLPFNLPFELTESMTLGNAQGLIQVMTIHKAKGQEFDFVFIPVMTEKVFASQVPSVMWRTSDKLEVEIERLCQDPMPDKETLTYTQKLRKVEEEARLVYVGLTRARKGLFLSYPMAQQQKWQRKPETQTPSRYFEALRQCIEQPTTEELTHAH